MDSTTLTPPLQPPPQPHDNDATMEEDKPSRNLFLANRSLNLETAAQFACLVAANHIDASTRDLPHLDINSLLERSMFSPHGLEEI